MPSEIDDLLELERELDRDECFAARNSLAVYCGMMLPVQVEDDQPLLDKKGRLLEESDAELYQRVSELEALAKKEEAERYIPASHHRKIIWLCEGLSNGYVIADRRTKLDDEVYEKGERIPIKRGMIFAPPGSAKSTYASVLFPSWHMGRRPRHNVIQGSYNDSLASRFGRRARNTYGSQTHRQIFDLSLARDSRAGGEWSTERGGEYFSFGINTGVTGRRANGIILDDLVKGRSEANSETVRNSTWDTYISDVRTRMFPSTWILYIGTRWHEDDPAGRILPANWDGESGWVKAKDGEWWYVLSFVAIVENEDDRRKDPLGRKLGEHLWPEWFPKKFFTQEKTTQGEYNWAALYKQRPHPLEGGIYKRKYFRLWPADEPLPAFSFILQSYDTAYTEKTANDPCACTVWGLFQWRKRWNLMLLDCWKDWLAYPELRRRVKLDYKAEYGDDQSGRHPERLHRVDIALVEDKGSGISLRQDLEMVNIQLWPYNPHKVDKTARLVAATPFGAAGVIWLMASAAHKTKPTQGYPTADGKAENDQASFMKDVLTAGPSSDVWDYADTFSQAVLYFRNNGMIEAPVATGEEEREEVDYREERRKPNPYGV